MYFAKCLRTLPIFLNIQHSTVCNWTNQTRTSDTTRASHWTGTQPFSNLYQFFLTRLASVKLSWRYLKRFKSYRVDKHTNTPANRRYWKQYHYRCALAVPPVMITFHLRQLYIITALFLSQARPMSSCGVRPPITFTNSAKTSNHSFKLFSTSGSQTCLAFPYQMALQYSDGCPPPTGESNAGVVSRNRDSEPVSG